MLEQIKANTCAFWDKIKASSSLWLRRILAHKISRTDLVIIFALSCALGYYTKVIAVNSFTIGYEDYRITANQNLSTKNFSEIAVKGPLCEE